MHFHRDDKEDGDDAVGGKRVDSLFSPMRRRRRRGRRGTMGPLHICICIQIHLQLINLFIHLKRREDPPPPTQTTMAASCYVCSSKRSSRIRRRSILVGNRGPKDPTDPIRAIKTGREEEVEKALQKGDGAEL